MGCTVLTPPLHPCGPPLIHSKSLLNQAMLVSRPYMSSLPWGSSVGIAMRMRCNSSTREAVWSSSELIDFGTASCNPGVPSVRVADLMRSSVLFKGCVMV